MQNLTYLAGPAEDGSGGREKVVVLGPPETGHGAIAVKDPGHMKSKKKDGDCENICFNYSNSVDQLFCAGECGGQIGRFRPRFRRGV